MTELNRYMDHTLLKADATCEDIKKLCAEAVKYNFFSVCVNPSRIPLCKELLKDTQVKTATVCGFPLGATSVQAKLAETEQAVEDGADEIDMVINIGKVKDGDYDYVENEIRQLADYVHSRGKLLKVIIETCLLTEDEKLAVSRTACKAGCDFLKTSTGFSTGGARPSDVMLMLNANNYSVPVKASGGIRTAKDAQAMIDAGASRLGVSASVKIMEELK